MKRMIVTPLKKDRDNSPCKNVNNYVTPVEKKRGDIIMDIREKILMNQDIINSMAKDRFEIQRKKKKNKQYAK
jgi:hypothetical protein